MGGLGITGAAAARMHDLQDQVPGQTNSELTGIQGTHQSILCTSNLEYTMWTIAA